MKPSQSNNQEMIDIYYVKQFTTKPDRIKFIFYLPFKLLYYEFVEANHRRRLFH